MILEWRDRNNYGHPNEIFYTSKEVDGKLNSVFRWDIDKKVDDYNKFHLVIDVTISDAEDSDEGGRRVLNGMISVKIVAKIERDYDERWTKTPKTKFLRAVYDKLISESKMHVLEGEIENDAKNLFDEVKRYFGR